MGDTVVEDIVEAEVLGEALEEVLAVLEEEVSEVVVVEEVLNVRQGQSHDLQDRVAVARIPVAIAVLHHHIPVVLEVSDSEAGVEALEADTSEAAAEEEVSK